MNGVIKTDHIRKYSGSSGARNVTDQWTVAITSPRGGASAARRVSRVKKSPRRKGLGGLTPGQWPHDQRGVSIKRPQSLGCHDACSARILSFAGSDGYDGRGNLNSRHSKPAIASTITSTDGSRRRIIRVVLMVGHSRVGQLNQRMKICPFETVKKHSFLGQGCWPFLRGHDFNRHHQCVVW
jgi:hypothetical protein